MRVLAKILAMIGLCMISIIVAFAITATGPGEGMGALGLVIFGGPAATAVLAASAIITLVWWRKP